MAGKVNRRSSVALAMRHRLQWFIHLRTHGLDKEMSTPPTLCCGVWPIYLTILVWQLGLSRENVRELRKCGGGGSLVGPKCPFVTNYLLPHCMRTLGHNAPLICSEITVKVWEIHCSQS